MPKKLTAVLLLAGALGCISRRVDVVPFLRPAGSASLPELVARINEWGSLQTLVLRVDLQFETVEEAEEGRGRKYRPASGRLLLEQPDHIRLNVEVPILNTEIAEMASDGERFQLLIHPPDYRALIMGSNRESYAEEMARLEQDPELKEAGPLLNIRPQHFTAALLPEPIDSDTLAFLHEEQAIEPDPRPRADEDAQVRKSYYVLTVVDRGSGSPRAQFWFDRSAEVTLSRQRLFDEEGMLTSSIYYTDFLPPIEEGGVRLPARVRIERTHDDYALVLNVQPDSIIVNRDLPDAAFVVNVPPEWGESVRRIDLDERTSSEP